MASARKYLGYFFKGLDVLNKTLLFIAVSSFCIICFAQVIFRYVFNNSIVWADQACRYLFCVSTFLGAALCVNEKKHTSIDILAEVLPKKFLPYQTILIYTLIAVFGVVLIDSGITLAAKSMRQKVTTLPLNMGVIYGMIPFSAAIITINALRVVGREIEMVITRCRKEENA